MEISGRLLRSGTKMAGWVLRTLGIGGALYSASLAVGARWWPAGLTLIGSFALLTAGSLLAPGSGPPRTADGEIDPGYVI